MPLERGPLNTFVSKNTKFESDLSKTNEDVAQICEILQTKIKVHSGGHKIVPTIPMSVKFPNFAELETYITFKLGKSTTCYKALFLVAVTDLP